MPGDGGTNDLSASAVVHVSGDIAANTTWSSATTYVIDSRIGISSALTIEAGTVVKFLAGAGLDVNAGGTLNAIGTATGPIVFTSIKDDAHGGDTNSDGNASSPSPRDWQQIYVSGSGSVTFDHCQFFYGGNTSSTLDLGVANNATVKNSVFAHNNGGTVAAGRGALDAGEVGSGTTITGNSFYANSLPVTINANFSFDDSNTFHDPANAASGNTYNCIVYSDSSDVSGNVTWSNTEVPYVVNRGSYFNIPTSTSLTLASNVVVKFGPGVELDVAGTLIARASLGSKITFTSLKDDSKVGDTNGDATASVPAPKDWNRIYVSSTGSVAFDHCEFLYGGGSGPTLSLGSSNNAIITNSLFANNDGGTVGSGYGVLDAGTAGAGTKITNDTFYGNSLPIRVDGTFSIDASNVFHDPANTARKNTYNCIVYSDYSDVTGNITWSNIEVPYVVNRGIMYIKSGSSLTLANSVVLKFGAGWELDVPVGASLVQGSGNVLTSIKDDGPLGDTNGDVGTTTPVKGDWKGVYYSSTPGWQNWANILYATNTTHNP